MCGELDEEIISFSIIIINDASTIKKKLIFKDKLCFNKIEILNLIVILN